MPIFEYVCDGCKREIEVLVYGSQKPACPHCASLQLTPKLSVFAVAAKGGSSATSRAPAGPCGSCGDPRGPGACSLGDLD